MKLTGKRLYKKINDKKLENGRFDVVKNIWLDDKKETSVWKNQDEKVLDNVLNWRPIYPNREV